MSKTIKRILSFGALALFFIAFLAPVTLAQGVECDSDADGFISFPASGADVILGEGVNVNGNYSAAEWANLFETFKNDPAAESLCSALNFKKGAEPTRCDKSLISPNSGVFDPSQAESVQGNTVYPTAFDKPDNGIDENCDGADGKLIEGGETGTNLGSLADRVVYMLSRAVVVISVIVLIWGGILYSTATGDERKTSKARKAIIGAIIGLAIGLLAPSIAAFIIASLA
ncbi:hypothetical protein KJ657_05400 [Patescibacteria group bacterium]|nr:hypothetical protein [Patescibacteria group bacterium]MBU1016493.1 hypothetical protein [Patescibacteria group bacterium]MBU1685128.1 hypothetical protein [Patescibacteria group bacterium]MBU1938628.1 hypothetical protein [Patescibacteria group bacterium]